MFLSLPEWLRPLLPGPNTLNFKEKVRAGAGGVVGIGITALWAAMAQTQLDLPWWMFAPLGASAAQIFSIPGAPFSQPWNVIVGHIVSGLTAIACFLLFGQTALGAGVAVGLSIFTMLMCRCLHASGGGTALLIVVAGISDPMFLMFPLTATSVSLVVVASLWFRLNGRVYPQAQRPDQLPLKAGLLRFHPDDLEGALSSHHQALGMSRDDIERLIDLTERNALSRMAQNRTTAQLMSTDPITVTPRLSVASARALLKRHDIKALPVVGPDRKLLGLFSDGDHPPAAKVAEVMRAQPAFLPLTAPAQDLIPLLAIPGQRHIVITDDQQKVAGIVTRSDLMRALLHTAV